MVTISDVAHAAGVSKATVSYVLSGDPRITQATTLKVQHAIDELGYTVNHAARALSVRKTKTIGVVSPAFHGNYLSALFGLYVYLLSEEATKRGYDTLLIGENDGFEAMHEAWSSKKVDGFILMDVKDEDPRVSYAAKEHIPTVAFGSPFSAVRPDIAQLSEAAVGALLRRINNPKAQTVTRYLDYPLTQEPE